MPELGYTSTQVKGSFKIHGIIGKAFNPRKAKSTSRRDMQVAVTGLSTPDSR